MKYLLVALFMVAGMFTVSSAASAEDGLTIQVPTDRAVYQRNNENKADITVSVKYDTEAFVEARVMQGDNEICAWSGLTSNDNDATLYEGKLKDIPAGGWYTLEVKVSSKSTRKEIASASVENFGVGEVFITGGQSNSCNFGEVKQTATEDMVSAYDAKTGNWVHCEDVQPTLSSYSDGGGHGSPWPAMGDELYKQLGVPIGFVTTGRGNTKISELCGKSTDGNKNAFIYDVIKQSIESIKPYGMRAFLIHQGEADESTDREQYKVDYLELINKTREDAGFDLPWIVAKVSYAWGGYNNPEKQKSLTDAQKAICNNYNIFEGPTTDDLLDGYRSSIDNIHLNEKGLVEHGKRWAAAVTEKLLTSYELKAADGITNGKIEQAGNKFYASDRVKITVVPDDGYCLKAGSVKVNDGAVEVTDNEFVMHAEDMTVSAEFEKLPQYILDLGAAIKKAEAINLANYTDAGKSIFTEALAAAKKVYDDSSKASIASEADAKQVGAKLTAAISALVLKPTQSAVPSPTPAINQQATPPVVQSSSPAALPAKGLTVTKSGIKFTITASTDSLKTVAVSGISSKTKTKLTIPKTVAIQGIMYKVTSIGKKAFYGAKKLKTLTIKTSDIKIVGKNAFKNVNAKIKIKVPSAKLSVYKKLFKGKGLKKTAKIVK